MPMKTESGKSAQRCVCVVWGTLIFYRRLCIMARRRDEQQIAAVEVVIEDVKLNLKKLGHLLPQASRQELERDLGESDRWHRSQQV